MRKRYKRGRGCPQCHPEKVGWERRWTPRELALRAEYERYLREAGWDEERWMSDWEWERKYQNTDVATGCYFPAWFPDPYAWLFWPLQEEQ